MHSQPPKSPTPLTRGEDKRGSSPLSFPSYQRGSGGLSDMASITGFTGIIKIDGIWFVVEDGQAYYFDDTDNED